MHMLEFWYHIHWLVTSKKNIDIKQELKLVLDREYVILIYIKN